MTPKAYCLIRNYPHYRHDAFRAGLANAGYQVSDSWPTEAKPGDLLVIWNRYFEYAEHAKRFEKWGGTVLVAENGYLGTDFNGGRWYALARHQHNGAGEWNPGGPERWASLGVELAPWREKGREIVILPQRGIGPPGVAMPSNWEIDVACKLQPMTRLPIRIRPHPGIQPCVPLDEDLKHAAAVVTWGSGAALKAMAWGIPCFHAMPNWIGAGASAPIDEFPNIRRPDRLPTFERLAWAMHTVEELASGDPFRRLAGGRVAAAA